MLPRRGPSFFFMALHAATPETCSTVHGQQEKRGGSLLGPGLSECKQGNTHLAACLMASRVPVALRLITFSYSSSCRQTQGLNNKIAYCLKMSLTEHGREAQTQTMTV